MTIPFITASQMREVDRIMVEEYGITLVQMMESAGRQLAVLARRRFLGGDPRGKKVLVLAGTGGNGGGGMVCARRLKGWGADVLVHLTKGPSGLKGVPADQLAILQKLPVQIIVEPSEHHWEHFDLIVDALIGYSLAGAPHGNAVHLIRSANMSGVPVLAHDVPSGLDATIGKIHEPTIEASATLTLALPKVGLRDALDFVGELYLGDIGVPPELYAWPSLMLEVGSIFAEAEIVRVDQ